MHLDGLGVPKKNVVKPLEKFRSSTNNGPLLKVHRVLLPKLPVLLMPNSCATILVLKYCSAHLFRITNDPLAGSNHKDFTAESWKPSHPHGFCVYHMLGWNMLKLLDF